MRRFSNYLIAGGLLTAFLIGLSAWAVYVNSARGEEVAAEASADRLLASPPAVYEKLQKRVQVDFQDKTLDEALASLADSLGAPIQLDRTGIDAEALNRKFAVKIDEPVTIQLALKIVPQYTDLYDRQITFTDQGVQLVGPEAAAGRLVLQSHDLRGASNYSTALRRAFVDRVRHEVAANTWTEGKGAWIAPASSVFAVDVYQTAAVQEQITLHWQQKYLLLDVEHPQIDLSTINLELDRFGKHESPEEVKKRAAELRGKYPLQSLAPRLKYETVAAPTAKPALSPAAAARLTEREEQAQVMRKSPWMGVRSRSLEQLHSEEVAKFVAREGFGLSRMPSPGPSYLPLQPPPQLALPSAEVEPPAYDSVANFEQHSPSNIPAAVAEVRMPSPVKLNQFHLASEGTFLSPERLGYVQDRDHVAGFGSHAFMSLPRLEDQAGWHAEPTEQWAIRRLELISILKHETPRVYVADELPNMEKLAHAPTRELGDFERRALAKLFDGEDVVTRASTNRIEMLGALRAHKQCMECHDVERGQVLGAFSYTLLRDPASPVSIEAH